MYITNRWTITPGSWDPIALLTNLEVQAVDVVEHIASFGDSKQECILSAITDPDECHFVLITADAYLEEVAGTYDLEYHVDEDTNQAIKLGTWHLWSAGMDEGLGAAGLSFDSIFVTNGHSATDALLTIYVGRDS